MRRLVVKLFLAQLLGLAIGLGIFSSLLSTAFHSLYLHLGQQQLVERAGQIARQIGPLIGGGRSEQELLETAKLVGASSNTDVCLEIPRGQAKSVIAQGPSGRVPGQAGPGADRARAAGEKMLTISAPLANCPEDMFLATVQLPEGKGLLHLRAPVSGVVDAYVHQLRRLVVYAGVVAALVALLVALVLARRMSGPLDRMRVLAARMADGDFSQRLRLPPADEIGELGHSLDSLADSLEATLAKLQDQQARLRGILLSVAEGIVAVDAEGRVSLINPQAADLLGVEPQGIMGEPVTKAGLPEQVAAQFSACLRENRLCSAELEMGESERQLVLQVAPVFTAGQERWGAVAVLRDVSEFRQLDRMRRRFISDASHEIRTPLTAIGGFAAAIADGTAASPEEQTRSAALIVREVERLSRLVNDLLDLSRIESGAVALHLEAVDVGELVRSAVEAFSSEIREQGLTVELDLPAGLPAARADPDRAYQVVANLISNAVRFNRPQGKIAVSTRLSDGAIRVEVRDTGPGISEAELPHIWERFHRGEPSRARGEGGTGLGLAIVRSLVSAHGGTVSVVSAVGEGSTFSFTLPAE
jgi:two-component system sensor histidine kinase ResE